MKYSSEDHNNIKVKDRDYEQFEEEEELIDYNLLSNYLIAHGDSCQVGKESLRMAVNNTSRILADNFMGDEMPHELRKYVKRIFYINSVCATQFGQSFIKTCINLDRAESVGGKDMWKIYVLLGGIENYREHCPADIDSIQQSA